MANNKGLGIQQSRGYFQARGIVNGVDRDSFYKELTTKSGKPMRMINFGLEVEKGKSIYISLNGMERDKVFFSKREDGKTTTKDVKWSERNTFKEKDFKLIGVNLGLEKTLGSDGNSQNKKMTLVEFDACKYIGEHLTDGMSVYVRGSIEYSTYNGKHQTKFIPQQISLCKEVDFEDEEYEPMAAFEQDIVLTGITKNKDEGNFVLSAKTIGYNSVEDVEMKMEGRLDKLAKNLKKFTDYVAMRVSGNIVISQNVEEVEDDDDEWGDPNPMKSTYAPSTRELFVVHVDKDSLDTELYSEEEIEQAIAKAKSAEQAKNDFGDDGEWETLATTDNEDDEEW